MPPFQTCRKGFEQDPVISGSVSSTQLCTGKTTSAYSQLPVHSQSFTITISTCGSTFAIILYAHFALFRLFELAVQMVFVGGRHVAVSGQKNQLPRVPVATNECA